uniref:Uncharacterized protein n=1 Tax=candidate division CPR3 bacterium TaxID=2268181 RepID=A0A7C4R4V3_UNCC3
MNYKIINYNEKYKKETAEMIEDFQKYLIQIDTWNVFKLEKNYGKKQLNFLLNSVKENKGKGGFFW